MFARILEATPTITVTASGASNSPQTVAVTLTLRQASAHVAPFGQVDTPAQNATGIVGAIGVTGWAIDDVGVSGVKIYRNCLEFDDPRSCQPIFGNRASCKTLGRSNAVFCEFTGFSIAMDPVDAL